MVINVRKWLEFLRLIVIFIFITFIFYQLISWTVEALSPKYQYKRPYGNSVEVISPIMEQKVNLTPKERFYYFWYTGE